MKVGYAAHYANASSVDALATVACYHEHGIAWGREPHYDALPVACTHAALGVEYLNLIAKLHLTVVYHICFTSFLMVLIVIVEQL